jgi:hypothetical protein
LAFAKGRRHLAPRSPRELAALTMPGHHSGSDIRKVSRR